MKATHSLMFFLLLAPAMYADTVNFTITSTVGLVYDATNTPGYPLVSPIQVGDTMTYSVSANSSSCALYGSSSTVSEFQCSGATDGVTMTFQTATGPLTFSTLGYLNIYVEDTPLSKESALKR